MKYITLEINVNAVKKILAASLMELVLSLNKFFVDQDKWCFSVTRKEKEDISWSALCTSSLQILFWWFQQLITFLSNILWRKKAT